MATSNVRVVLRIRPFIPSEIDDRSNGTPESCVTVVENDEFNTSDGGEVTVQIKDRLSSRKECYKLDSIYNQENDLLPIFQQEVTKIIPEIFQGSNGTVFTYGATGSGKTYTMQGTDEHPGLIALALSSIFSTSKIAGGSVEISYYEVYLDRCYDLLEPKAKEIMVLEDKDGIIQFKGLSKISVGSMEEFDQIFSCGVQRREVAQTGLNDVSSRSHGILSIFVSTKIKNTDALITGKLNLIDLAGYEENRRTYNEGIRLQESAKINQSLFALSNVIYALNNNEVRVPYRESKLTRILQDSLGGPNQSLLIACLNPVSYSEAIHTVGLAARSRHVVIHSKCLEKMETPRIKVDMEEKLRVWIESKGKCKSTHKIFSSCGVLGKTPNPKSKTCQKRTNAARSNKITTTNDHFVSRKLFDAPVVELEEKEKIDREAKQSSSSIQNVLSSLNVNTTPIKKNIISDKEEICCDNTPLNKFTALGSTLKKSLENEYLEVLNIASKEELLSLKGIGPKRAENIIALRIDSSPPFKTISDLEKIGLSTKQVKDIFVRAAKEIFV